MQQTRSDQEVVRAEGHKLGTCRAAAGTGTTLLFGLQPLVKKPRVQRRRHSCPSLRFSQIYDNAMIAAGLNDDPRPMISRLNELLTKAMEKH